MSGNRATWKAFRPLFSVFFSFALASILVSADRSLKREFLSVNTGYDSDSDSTGVLMNFLWQSNKSDYDHVWPDMEFNWKIVIGTILGFLGGALGSVGGVGGGGIFIPMLTLVVGFDPKSAAAISKCMIMGAAVSTVYYNLKLRHPTLDMPIIDYDLAVLIQPMLLLGISIGVTFNVLFADWMITVLLIILFIVTSTKAFFKGVDTWKKESILKQDAAESSMTNGNGEDEAEYNLLPGNNTEKVNEDIEELEVGILENVYWKQLGLLVFVWIAFLTLQILKNYTNTCSALYWGVNLLQIPVAVSVSGYQALCLYKGWRKIASNGEDGKHFKVHQLISYGLYGVLAGTVGGLLGVGGGSVMGPLFLELGIPPQVSSATATFAMMFSSSMSVVEYYLLKRFPIPYAVYLVVVATVAALIGQHVVRRLILILGRASIIIFVLAFMIFISAISLGGVGISRMITKIQKHEYMGFENLCKYDA